jgi:hypothetical protein
LHLYRKEDDGGTYFCQAENVHGMTRSKNATLTVAGKLLIKQNLDFFKNGKRRFLQVEVH